MATPEEALSQARQYLAENQHYASTIQNELYDLERKGASPKVITSQRELLKYAH